MILALFAGAFAGTPVVCDPADWPASAREPMRLAQARGLALARHDRYAWLASDRLTEANPGGVLGVDGYLVAEKADGSAEVLFIDEETLTVRVRVSFSQAMPNGWAETVTHPLDPALAPAFLATRAAPKDPRVIPKAPRYNADVLADETGWLVYLVPAATDLSDVPLGGGYAVHVQPDGRSVDSVTPISQGILSVPVDRLRAEKGLFAATVLTPLPDPTYVAFAATWEITLAVVTAKGTWLLGGDKACFSAKK